MIDYMPSLLQSLKGIGRHMIMQWVAGVIVSGWFLSMAWITMIDLMMTMINAHAVTDIIGHYRPAAGYRRPAD